MLSPAMLPTAGRRVIRLVSNLSRLPREVADTVLDVDVAPTRGASLWSIVKAHIRSLTRDAYLLHCPSGKELFGLCLLRWLVPSRAKLICSDVILTKPGPGAWGRLKALVKGLLLRRIDLFLLHQKDFQCLEDAYGINPRRCRYIPFKVNSWQAIARLQPPEGDYVFSGGKSRRDYQTLIQAVRELPLPTVIVMPPAAENTQHGTYFDERQLPAHVRIVHDDGTPQSFIDYLCRARLVVLPVRPDSISPSGVGVYLMAMALRKCVIVTDGPATHDILENDGNAILVPPADAVALRDAIRRAWHDDSYRRAIAERAQRYARSLGGEAKLLRNLAEETAAFLHAESASGVDSDLDEDGPFAVAEGDGRDRRPQRAVRPQRPVGAPK